MRQRAIERYESGERPKLFRTQAKAAKAAKYGWYQGILHLSPADSIHATNLCPMASQGCRAACLHTAGRGADYMLQKEGRFKGLNSVQEGRALRTIWFERDRDDFIRQLKHEIKLLIGRAKRAGLKPVIRLNGTSDFPFHKLGIMQEFPDVQFIDYTKNAYKGKLPDNYRLCFSRSESNQDRFLQALARGQMVSVVFRDKLPKTYMGRKVVDGDKHDLIHLHEQNVVLGLKAKGKGRKDTSGFVVDVEEESSQDYGKTLDRMAA